MHCEYCHCPVEKWEPLTTYPTDDSCRLFDDVYDIADIIQDEKGIVTYSELLAESEQIKAAYAEVVDFPAAVKECFDILEDIGVINYNPSAVRP